MKFAEIWRILLFKQYIKMYLVRNSRIIDTYINPISKRNWIKDKSKKLAWMIPQEEYMIRYKKSLTFYGSLDTIQAYDISKVKELHTEISEMSIPFIKINSKSDTYKGLFQKSKLTIIKGKKIKEVDKICSSYVLNDGILDPAILYEYLEGEVEKKILALTSKKDDIIKWIIYGLIAIGALYVIYMVLNGG